MRGMRARQPKNFVLEERLERYADAIELQPVRLAGRWAEACWPLGGGILAGDTQQADATGRFERVVVDLGCGKGSYAVELARRNPDTLVVGVDFEPICIAYAAQEAMEGGVRNAVFVPGKAELVAAAFAPGEIARMHVNFPTPYPRVKDAPLRLVSLEHLLSYREALGPGGELFFKTDSYPLREFALDMFAQAGYELLWRTDDARAEHPDEPYTLYEERLGVKGAKVYELDYRVADLPRRTADALQSEEGTAELLQSARHSLTEFLPTDLDELDYVPYGMEATVTNMRNRARNLQEGKR